MRFPGTEFFHDHSMGFVARVYCLLLGLPIIGLRIRLRRLSKILPGQATSVLDAGCGRGVISRTLAIRYPAARVVGIDQDESAQASNIMLANKMGLVNCKFEVADVTTYDAPATYDLIVSVDNLEHVAQDREAIANFFKSMKDGGTLVVHVPHFYRRWPLFKWTTNFDVPGHVRPGYHLAELTERVRGAGFDIRAHGFSYGFLENLSNNLSYAVTGAREQRKAIYALLFPPLNVLAWLGQWSRPRMGAALWMVASKSAQQKPVAKPEEEDELIG